MHSIPVAWWRSGRQGDDQHKQEQEDAKKKKKDKDWGDNQAALPQLRNAGPARS